MKVSNSSIQAFKQCRRLYELKYIHGLEPVQTAEYLERGLKYHELVEGILNGTAKPEDCENPKIRAMGEAFKIFILPSIRVGGTEQWVSYQTKSGHTVIGRIDARDSRNSVVEHKSISGPIDGDYFTKLQFDEQIPTYMLACGTNRIIYTVCSVPSIRQKKGESDDDFFKRCLDWICEDSMNRITSVELVLTDEQLSRFADEQDAIITEMQNCKLFYRNPGNCYKYGKLCEYASVCLDYDPDKEYIEFRKRCSNGDQKT